MTLLTGVSVAWVFISIIVWHFARKYERYKNPAELRLSAWEKFRQLSNLRNFTKFIKSKTQEFYGYKDKDFIIEFICRTKENDAIKIMDKFDNED